MIISTNFFLFSHITLFSYILLLLLLGDHGPFNSWDRDPYLITDPITGQVTTTKAYDVLEKNFIIANYNSLGSGMYSSSSSLSYII